MLEGLFGHWIGVLEFIKVTRAQNARWEVPAPRAIEVICSSSSGEGTDPRFVKLTPVFRCSVLKCGNQKSIPLTVEWSASPPHDYLVAGCHDGTVVMWKFCPSDASQDTRPILCFTADTNPIRALRGPQLKAIQTVQML